MAGSGTDDCRKDIRSFYEKHPYPAPPKNLDDRLKLYTDPDRRRVMFHLLWPGAALADRRRILVAGCGTSQAAAIALREPGAEVVGIDISSTSLGHTRKLSDAYGLTNLALHQLALDRVEDLGQSFDQIVCTGVLHHLPNPDRGLKALRAVLAAGGAMQLMVYALYGRSGIYMLQQYCRLLGLGTSNKDLHELRDTLNALPASHPLAAVMHSAKDFQQPDALADALLHPQDRAYSVPQLFDWLERCGIRFGRWFDQAPYLPQCGTLAATSHATRLGRLPASDQHAAVELFRGTITKHHFIAYRDDAPADWPWHPFEAGHSSRRRHRWGGLIPIRIPWTQSVRNQRLPHGAVAVLINRGHHCPDLFLPINKQEELLHAAIDGKQNLTEIIDGHAEIISENRALTFFRRLWQYDQIVFDASKLHAF